jgi:hypothetical protein
MKKAVHSPPLKSPLTENAGNKAGAFQESGYTVTKTKCPIGFFRV